MKACDWCMRESWYPDIDDRSKQEPGHGQEEFSATDTFAP